MKSLRDEILLRRVMLVGRWACSRRKKPPSGSEVARSDGRREIHSLHNCEHSEQYHLPQANITAEGNITAKQYNKKSHSVEWLFLYSVAYLVSEIDVSV